MDKLGNQNNGMQCRNKKAQAIVDAITKMTFKDIVLNENRYDVIYHHTSWKISLYIHETMRVKRQ